MTAESEFKEQNWFRATRQANKARILAKYLSEEIQRIFPELFVTPPRVTAIQDQGWSNLTLMLERDDGGPGFIIRLAPSAAEFFKSRSLPRYEKERYVLESLKDFKLSPKLPENCTGRAMISIPGRQAAEFAFLLEERIPFDAARIQNTEAHRESILEQLGEQVREIHKVKLNGFGYDFAETEGRFLYPTFREFVEARMSMVEHSPASPNLKKWLTARTELLININPEPHLFHRDLLGNFGNILIDDQFKVRGIIDWEFAGAGPAFHYEIASMLYVLSRDGAPAERVEKDLQAVLRGYGMTREFYREHYERDIDTLVLLNAVTAMIKYEALKKGGDISSEPWRAKFAERGEVLCRRKFAQDRGKLRRISRRLNTGKKLSGNIRLRKRS